MQIFSHEALIFYNEVVIAHVSFFVHNHLTVLNFMYMYNLLVFLVLSTFMPMDIETATAKYSNAVDNIIYLFLAIRS